MARRDQAPGSPAPPARGPDYWRQQVAAAAAKKSIELARKGPAWETFKQDPTFAEVVTLQLERESDHFATDVVNGSRRSGAGAWGIAQIMMISHPTAPPGTQPHAQILWAVNHMGTLCARYFTPPGKGEKLSAHDAKMDAYRNALSVYNSGGIWATGKHIKETRDYVNGILGTSVSLNPNDPKDSILDWGKGIPDAVAGAVTDPLEAVGHFFQWIGNRDNAGRVIGIVVGVFLVLYSLILISRELGLNVPKFGPKLAR